MNTWTLITQSTPGTTTRTFAATPSPSRALALAGLIAAAGDAITRTAGPLVARLHLDGQPVAVVAVQTGPDGTPDRDTAYRYLERVYEALTTDAERTPYPA